MQLVNQNSDLIKYLEDSGIIPIGTYDEHISYGQWVDPAMTQSNSVAVGFFHQRIDFTATIYSEWTCDMRVVINSPTDYYIEDIKVDKFIDNGDYEAYLQEQQGWENWLEQEQAGGNQPNQSSALQSGQQPSSQTQTLLVSAVSEATVLSQPDATGVFRFQMVCKDCGWTKDSSMFAMSGSFGASSFKCGECSNYIKSTFRGE
jgi:hypothetical protein